ncbi:MAG: DUF1800 domain-containing protein [Gammaproteobacteria bacterium]|nr:MAG: DUF1800 domain-containing protein [Gammaproteobacteria bacterium]
MYFKIAANKSTNSHPLIFIFILLSSFFISACGGGDGDPAPIPEQKTKLTSSQASAFLNRATFGATRKSIDDLVNSNLEDWLQQQLLSPPSRLLPYIQSLAGQEDINPNHRVQGWWLNVVHGDDQLRQRVAFALSEILVVSDQNDFLFNRQAAMANYYDILVNNAFGNYRELLEKVTLSPVMGVYLSMLGNQKPDPENNIRPDENYAREIMQLFSIGLVELNQDGSAVTDGQGNPVASYDQDIIEGFAHVFTGWTFYGATDFRWPDINMIREMEPWEDFHDTEEKALLNDTILPAGQTATEDLEMALDNIFEHNNVAPFISHKLIQRLVTSNPSPAYINRVAAIFNDNGQGEKGDLEAVVIAIITDDEAFNGFQDMPNTFGKLREPLIRNAHLWRAFNASTNIGTLPFGWPEFFYGQSPQRAPHVFNYFYPDYQPPGEISDGGLVAPEFQIATAGNLTGMHNVLLYLTLGYYYDDNPGEDDDIALDLDELAAIANNHNQLVDQLDLIFTAGQMSAEMKEEIISYLGQFSAQDNERLKVVEATFLILTSNEYVIQK